MSTGAAPAKKKPLLFKRRAVPVAATNATAHAAGDPDDASSNLASTAKNSFVSAADSSVGNGGVDLFRRSKQFFPKALEEQSRRLKAEKRRKQQAAAGTAGKTTKREPAEPRETSSTPPPSPSRSGHDVKRRKVSPEVGDAGTSAERRPTPDGASLSPTASPAPQRTVDKGKGRAVDYHDVNAHIVFASESAPARSPSLNPEAYHDEDEDDPHGFYGHRGRRKPAAMGADVTVADAPIRADEEDNEGQRAIKLEILDDEEEEEEKKKKDGDDDDDDDDDSIEDAIDPEFEEYIIRARARDAAARAAQAAHEAAGGSTVLSPGATRAEERTAASGLFPASQETTTAASTPTATQTQTQAQMQTPTPPSPARPPADQHYRIFITPHLPAPVPPLIANVRMDQKMVHVHNAFVAHARSKGLPLTDEEAAAAVLTWKGNKIYSWTTGSSLGIRPDAHGRFRDEGEVPGPGAVHYHHRHGQPAGFVSGGLHLEFWTEALYNAYLIEQEKRRLRNLGELVEEDLASGDDDNDADGVDGSARVGGAAHATGDPSSGVGANGGAPSSAAAEAPQRIRLVLKSRDYEKLNITAYSNTTVATLIAAFREQRQIGLDKTVAIYWDGDRLDEDTTVGEAEIEDMESVEVHIH
ncbi:Small ubiquitin-related modifier, SUMO [Niveomyces insectorum RCEF 264]|uniref:Small ubiquitin-related modifier, SUMO n=1 Tax=Niveomyces insectorum RCEF 264 TaxID=1081102 RepID=A0A167REQ8_9HYPO|nr:Small ubiquitin-related modifier, SUMO [Niveomyces insectorum RCEF 264]